MLARSGLLGAEGIAKRWAVWIGSALALLGGLLVQPSFAEDAASGDIAIVVNPTNKISNLSLDELRDLWSLRQQFWPSGHRVVLFLPAGSSPQKAVLLRKLYEMSDADLRRYWTEQLFRGAIAAIPSTIPSTTRTELAVQQSAGGIAAVPAAEVPASVRVVSIDGKRPGEAGYALSNQATALTPLSGASGLRRKAGLLS